MHISHSNSPVQIKRARIEIIPLIDIMFFLLASFMLVSIDALIDIYIEKDKVPKDDVLPRLQKLYDANHDVRVFIRADKDATYETVVFVLDKARTAGIQKVGLEIKAYDSGSDPSKGSPAGPAAPPPAPASH